MLISNPTAKKGEGLAAAYLAKHGYKIIERNFRKGYGEIDIIAIKDNTLIFVEVKTRTSFEFGEPLESITYSKLKTLVNTARFYKLIHPKLPEAMRIDAMSVKLFLNGDAKEINHVKNISQF